MYEIEQIRSLHTSVPPGSTSFRKTETIQLYSPLPHPRVPDYKRRLLWTTMTITSAPVSPPTLPYIPPVILALLRQLFQRSTLPFLSLYTILQPPHRDG